MPLKTEEVRINPKTNDFERTYKSDPVVDVGVCQIQGNRKYQEDFLDVSIDAVQSFNQLSNEAQAVALKFTLMKMQSEHGQPLQGSTACIATAWLDEHGILKITTGNLGDSAAY